MGESKKISELYERNWKIFEPYLAYSFSEELKCKDFVRGEKYSLLEEIIRIDNIIKMQKDINIKEIKENLVKFIQKTDSMMKNFKNLSSFSINSESESGKKAYQVVAIIFK